MTIDFVSFMKSRVTSEGGESGLRQERPQRSRQAGGILPHRPQPRRRSLARCRGKRAACRLTRGHPRDTLRSTMTVPATEDEGDMPAISHFFGIVITMYYDDHPPPHFRVRYGGQKALVAIDTLSLIRGQLLPRVLGLVVEWASRHQAALAGNWALATRQQPLQPIQPLE